MLFVLFQIGLGGTKQSIATSIALVASLAFAIYVPLGYKIDHCSGSAGMRKAGRPIPERKPAARASARWTSAASPSGRSRRTATSRAATARARRS